MHCTIAVDSDLSVIVHASVFTMRSLLGCCEPGNVSQVQVYVREFKTEVALERSHRASIA